MASMNPLPERLDMNAQELQDIFDRAGMAGLKKHLEKSLDAWKSIPLYIGVTGRSGVGKSSFINAIRGLSAEDKGAAEVGVTETTTVVQQYPHPKNPQLVLCDLPGAGTKTFSRDSYFTDRRIGFDRFDLFLILTADRFMEDDLWLAKGIKQRGKGFLFIRTKIDQDVENEKKTRKAFYKSNPEAIKEVIEKIRINCEKNLQEFFSDKAGTQKIFLIDSYECGNPLYDFDILLTNLIENFPALKKDAFIMSMTSLTPGMIDAKKEVLRGRIWSRSLLSAIGGAVPIPGLSMAVDVGIILSEAMFYREQLGLNEDKLREVADNIAVPWQVFQESVKLESLAVQFTTTGMLQFCSLLLASETVETVGLTIPIIGSIIGATLSFTTTKITLGKILDMMVDDAKKLNEYIRTQTMSTTLL